MQKQIANLVKERGYWDGLGPEQLVCRHVAKLTEELSEVATNIYSNGDYCGAADWLSHLNLTGRAARHAFDNRGEWEEYKIASADNLKSELADLLVVIFSMAEILDFDVVSAALEKASQDVERGVRSD